MRRLLLVLLCLVGGVVLLLGGAFAYAQTSLGRAQLGGVIERNLSQPGRTAAVEAVGGLIPFNIRLGRLRLADDAGTWLEVDGARVDLSPTDLLTGRIVVRSAGAERVRVERLPEAVPAEEPAEPQEPFTLPRLPDTLPVIVAERLYVDALELGPAVAGQEARFRLDGGIHTSPGGEALDASLDLVRTDADTARATLRAALDFAGQTVDLAVQASDSGGLVAGLTGRPEADPVTVDLQVRGPFSAVAGRLTANAGQIAELAAELELAIVDQPSIALDGTLTVAEGALPDTLATLVGPRLDVRVRGGQRGADRFALEELGVTAAQLRLTGQGSAALDTRSLGGTFGLEVGDLAAASGLAGVPLGGSLRIDGTAGGSLDRPELSLGIVGEQLSADAFAARRLATDLTITLLGPLDRGYAGVAASGSGGAQAVTLDGAPLPAAADPTWRIVAELPASGPITIETLELKAEALIATLHGTVDPASLTGQGRLAVEAPDLAAIVASLGPLAPDGLDVAGAVVLAADATMRPTGDVMDVELRLTATGLTGLPDGLQQLVGAEPRLTGRATVTGGERVEVERIELSAAGLSVTGNGRVRLGDRSLGAEIDAEIADLSAFAAAAGQALAGAGRLRAELSGTLDDPRLAFDAAVDGLAAAGLSFERVALTGTAAGPISRVAGDLRLDARQAAGDVTLVTAYARDGDRLTLDRLALNGPGTELKGAVEVDLATLIASGRLAGGVRDLAALRPWHGQEVAGAVDLEAQLSAPEGRQDVTVKLTARDIAGGFGRITTASVDANLRDVRGALNADASLALDGFSGDGVTVEAASLTARGPLSALQLEAAARGEQQGPFDLSARSRVDLTGPRRRAELQALDGIYAGQSIQLRAPAALTLEGGVLEIDQLDLRIGEARIQGRLDSRPSRVQGRATVRDLPLAMLAAFGAPPLDGTAEADLTLSGSPATPQVDLVLRVPELRLADQHGMDVPPAALTLDARASDGKLTARLELAKLTDRPAVATLTLPLRLSLTPFVLDLPPEGRLDGALAADFALDRLAALAALDGQRLDGPASARLRLSGTLAAPRVDGRVDLGPASIEDALTGLHYRDVRLGLVAAGSTVRIDELHATTRGDGSLDGSGQLEIGPSGAASYALELRLRRAEVLRNDLGRVVASGEVDVTGDLGSADLTARIEINRADLEIPEGGAADIPTIEVMEIGSGIAPGAGPAADRGPPFTARLDARVEVPARLFIRGRGLDSEWGGALTITGEANAPRILGELSYRRGFLDFLDRRFNIATATIAFTGATPPVPEVHLEATAQASGLLATVRVTGPADDFRLELTSEPPLPQDEVLAQLLFRRGTASMTPLQGLRLANAVATLEGGGFDALGKLRRGLGLDTLDVDTAGGADGDSGANAASLRAGKYIDDRVYVEVQQGVAAATSAARVEVELTPSLRATSTVTERGQPAVGLEWRLDY